jgi:hypothetical protein
MAASKGSGASAARKSTAAAPAADKPAATPTVDTTNIPLSPVPGVADTAGLTEDDLTAAPASAMDASGAFVEPEIKERIDVDHPAVDNNPRAGQPAIANQIDFNDPTRPGHEIVEEATRVSAKAAKEA